MHTALASKAQVGGPRASGGPPPGVAGWLGLAAAPTFAVMALWAGLSGNLHATLGMTMQGSSWMSGMKVMYLLMSVFHAGPWLNLICRHSGKSSCP